MFIMLMRYLQLKQGFILFARAGMGIALLAMTGAKAR
jgi:hypothetical protein